MMTPLILGRGRAGQAVAKSFAILGVLEPEWEIAPAVWLARDISLSVEREKYPHPILCLTNPHGLHASGILEGEKAGYEAILCEKPACVGMEQLESLRSVKVPTAILHGYRQMWGPQLLKKMIDAGELGELVTVEGRYWQSSTALKSLSGGGPSNSWKNDTRLAGGHDVYLDIGSHWIDLVSYLHGQAPSHLQGWRSFNNAEASHRDSHVQVCMEFHQGRAFASFSKNVHGATNHFEINIMGSKKSATWEFLKPDEIVIGEGRQRGVLTRDDSLLGSRQDPFHGLGWLDGYVEVIHALVSQAFQGKAASYPRLRESLTVLEAMFKTDWQNTH